MQSLRFNKFGEPAEVLELVELPKPEPQAGQVLVKMLARPINPSDLYFVRGIYGFQPQFPATPGFEGAGIIESIGDGVTGLQAGQKVIPLGVIGTWAEYIVANANQVIPYPNNLSDSIAAQFVVNPLTAWVMIVDELKVQPGEWLLQTAAGSTLGRMVLQIAKLKGFKTINVVRRREQVDELKSLGADEIICSSDEDIPARVREITEGRGVKHAIDAVGGKTGSDVASSLASGGTLLVYGLLSQEPLSIDGGQMIFLSSTVRGFWLTRWMHEVDPAHRQAVATEMIKMMANGEIAPPIEAEYPMKDFATAIEHAERPGRSGKVLIRG
ncbi:MAG TPA: zinc-dependent alcohol dehydrogenase family protein [Blastocatellia bacterium]|nr:zinc-dependent alcohol dehydrogenase family protein [Blastocatellia bacterium]